jgi:UDP-N-acetylmuramyl tripeptide synthase
VELIQNLWLVGANRYRDETVCEQIIRLSPEELLLRPNLKLIEQTLEQAQMPALASSLPEIETTFEESEVGALYPRLCLALQQQVGHRVRWARSRSGGLRGEIKLIFEYEHTEVGRASMELSLLLVLAAYPGLSWPASLALKKGSKAEKWRQLCEIAAATLFPVDSEVLLRAAWRRGINGLKLERDPYRVVRDVRVRRNALLRLGTCGNQRLLDGMLCLDRSGHLVTAHHDRTSLNAWARKYRFACPRSYLYEPSEISVEQALEAVCLWQFPLVLKPRFRSHGNGLMLSIADQNALRGALTQVKNTGAPAMLQPFIQGQAYRLLLANGTLLFVLDELGREVDCRWQVLLDLACRIAKEAECGLLEIGFIECAPEQNNPAKSIMIIDINFAPRLDRLCGKNAHLMHEASERFLDWLFPPGSATGPPLVAVTGTNGKTTTSRMITRMFAEQGLQTTMTGTRTAERWIAGRRFQADLDGDKRFAQLGDGRAEAVVQETHFGLIARVGFSWQRCTVGIVTNVTEDHIGRIGVDSIKAMAKLKSIVAQRADTAVLNADDAHCLEMYHRLQCERTILVSLESSPGELYQRGVRRSTRIIWLGMHQGREHILLHEHGENMAVVPVTDIPATFGGLAKFNISNAMQAVAAGHICGLPPEVMATALRGFVTDFEVSPGRMNIYDNGRFKVLLDFAHNTAGFAAVGDFVAASAVLGRRIVVCGASQDRQETQIRNMMQSIAETYDHYILRSPNPRHDKLHENVPSMCARFLGEFGVSEDRIEVIPDPIQAAEAALRHAEDGDLVVLHLSASDFNSAWALITRFR